MDDYGLGYPHIFVACSKTPCTTADVPHVPHVTYFPDVDMNFHRRMCYEKTQTCTTKLTVWVGYNYVFQVEYWYQLLQLMRKL